MRIVLSALTLLIASCSFNATDTPVQTATSPKIKMPKVRLVTSLGNIVIQLNPEKAPLSSANFLSYVKEGFYQNTLFHRVIPGFMAQGGGFTPELEQKTTHPPVKNESNNGLSNKRGTVALARTADPDTATSQFYINYVDNDFLDYKNPSYAGIGYAVFGEVIEGMDVVDKMAEQETGSRDGPKGYGFNDIPLKDIILQKAEIIEE
ncbi:MAG: peptidylprolyl isomerase [Methylobacter sp.]|nr:MAG: peptidylprolyl isomerase [Methylobacter sp.]